MSQNKLFPFSTVVFASWDFHLTNHDAARNLRYSIRNQLKEMLNDATLADIMLTTYEKFRANLLKASARQGPR